MVADLFDTELRAIELPDDADWRERVAHQTPDVAQALKDYAANDFPLLAAVVADRGTASVEDFEFNVSVVIAGLERLRAP